MDMKKLIDVYHATVKILYLICIMTVLVGTACLLITGRYSLFGYRPIYVATGSMEPAIHAGSFVIAKTADPEDISEGDVVVYTRSIRLNGTKTHKYIRVIHRITGMTKDGGFILKGDANAFPDDRPVYKDQILYKVTGR